MGGRCGPWASARAAMPAQSRRRWAAALFAEAAAGCGALSLATRLGLHTPRTGRLLRGGSQRIPTPRELRHLLADRLMSLMCSVETNDWVWFEDGLAYDNARLPQALIVTGMSLGAAHYVAAGLRSLRWLMTLQTSGTGVFRPVGSDSFGDKRNAAARVRSAASRSRRDDLGLPCGLARGRRSQMEG